MSADVERGKRDGVAVVPGAVASEFVAEPGQLLAEAGQESVVVRIRNLVKQNLDGYAGLLCVVGEDPG
jgi:hypothetical protein